MIWDCFLLGGEDDLPMLECRLSTLAGTGVRHVLAESTRDFHGRDKPAWYGENRDLFTTWPLDGVRVNLPLPGRASAWTREATQREALGYALSDLGAMPDDLVMLSDVDEIPRPDVVGAEGAVLLQTHLVHSLQWKAPTPWRGTVCLRFGEITSFQQMRDMRHSLPGVQQGGWHLSWMGSPVAKLDTTSHTELPESFRDGVRSGSCKRDGWHLDGDQVVKMVPAGPADWPRWVRDGHAPEQWGAHEGAGERSWEAGSGSSGPG
jgi:beta-1,4-mannosyl-glycoprotein beta-1,4-N-acetylglucosaminyltransferase